MWVFVVKCGKHLYIQISFMEGKVNTFECNHLKATDPEGGKLPLPCKPPNISIKFTYILTNKIVLMKC